MIDCEHSIKLECTFFDKTLHIKIKQKSKLKNRKHVSNKKDFSPVSLRLNFLFRPIHR